MVLAIGVLYMNDYQKLKKTEEVIAQMDKEKAEENLIETEPVNGWISEENAKEEDNTEKQGSNNAATEKPEDGETDSKETEDTMEKPEESEKVQESAAVNTDVVRETYTIQNGDTLSSISRKYYGNLEQVKAICELNGLSDEDLVYPGQKILLP